MIMVLYLKYINKILSQSNLPFFILASILVFNVSVILMSCFLNNTDNHKYWHWCHIFNIISDQFSQKLWGEDSETHLVVFLYLLLDLITTSSIE